MGKICSCSDVPTKKEQLLVKDARYLISKITATEKATIKENKTMDITSHTNNGTLNEPISSNNTSKYFGASSLAASTPPGFTNKCSAIDDCLSVKRIGETLKLYDKVINDDNNNKGDRDSVILSNCLLLEKYLCETNINLMNDFGHIIYKHLDVYRSDAQYEQIYDYLIKTYALKCSISKCSKYYRNCRNIQKEKIKINNNNEDENNYRLSAYIDVLDTIHCHVLHSYDMAFRVRQTELDALNKNISDNKKAKNVDLSDDDVLKVNADQYMMKLSDTVVSKRKLLKRAAFGRIKNNKFVTVFNEEQVERTFIDFEADQSVDDSTLKELQMYLHKEEYDTDAIYDDIDFVDNDKCNIFFNLKLDKQRKLDCIAHIRSLIIGKKQKYSFGVEFHYWPKYKRTQSFVAPKYSDFKDEIYQHHGFDIFNNLYTTIQTFYSTNQHIKKKLKSKKTYQLNSYGYEDVGVPVSIQHLVALKLYTDATELSAEFSRSFRKLNENESNSDVKKRNESFAHWSRLLREIVEIHGEDAFYSAGGRSKPYYHGTSYMFFNEFSARFCAPTSTTKELSVALSFAQQSQEKQSGKQSGIILELHVGAYVDAMMFNASFLSCFSNEDERLLFCGRRKWRFASIRLYENNKWNNYTKFVNALAGYHAVLQGICAPRISGNVMKVLVDHVMKNTDLNVSPYIKDTFIALCSNITEININFFYFPFKHKYYSSFFISNYSQKDEKGKETFSLNFRNILNAKKKLWKNLRKISYCKWDHNTKPKLIDVDSKYLLSLYKEICSIQDQILLKGMEINIPFTKANFEYSKLKRAFSPYLLKVRPRFSMISSSFIEYDKISIQF